MSVSIFSLMLIGVHAGTLFQSRPHAFDFPREPIIEEVEINTDITNFDAETDSFTLSYGNNSLEVPVNTDLALTNK
eukprot:gene852-315_t